MAKKAKQQQPKAAAAAVPTPWRNRITRYGEEAPDQLLAHERNYRLHPLTQQQALKGVLEKVGIVQNVIVSENSGKMLDGHLRALMGISEGQATIPVTYVDVSPEEELLILAALDATSAMAGTDQELLDSLIAEIRTSDIGMELSDGLTDLLESLSPVPENVGLTGEDEVPEPPANPVTLAGDLWLMPSSGGGHRLLCGDSTKPECVARLMNGENADLLVTDEPYGVSYSEKNRFLNAISRGNCIQEPIEGDSQTPAEMQKFWIAAFTATRTAMKPGAAYYVTGPQGGDLLLLLQSLSQSGFPLRHMLIWAKNNHVLGRCDYNYKHEPIIYGWVEGAGHKFYGAVGETSLWEIPKPHKSDLHPTMKPVALYARAIRNSSKRGEIVLDVFAGSGTAAIACEETERQARLIELDPHYCDVICQRFIDFSGKQATLDSTGQTFAQVRESRLGTTAHEVISERAESAGVAA